MKKPVSGMKHRLANSLSTNLIIPLSELQMFCLAYMIGKHKLLITRLFIFTFYEALNSTNLCVEISGFIIHELCFLDSGILSVMTGW